MSAGAFIPSPGLYLVVEQSGHMVKRIFFSSERPKEASPLAEEIALHLEKDAPCPKADLDLSECTAFQREIYSLIREIPRGRTMTYGQVADLAGKPGAARAVGQALASNPFAILVPCHRVVSRSGPGGYAYGRDIKEKLLLLERPGY
jgi:methylated-DNA-[protein]-cysteine S-methyltransferase